MSILNGVVYTQWRKIYLYLLVYYVLSGVFKEL